MAQKKTTSGSRSGTKKSSSAARGTTKKKTASSRGGSSRSQKTKTSARSSPAKNTRAKTASSRSGGTAKRASAPARSGTRAAAAQPARRPVRRQVGCWVLLFLGLVAAIGYFPVDAWLVRGIRETAMGLFGWGFYIVPPCLLWGALILLFHRGRPVAARLVCVLLLPLVFGTFIHVLLFPEDNIFSISVGDGIGKLWRYGQYVTEYCGGVISGALGIALKKSVGIVGGFLVLVLAFFVLLLQGMSLSVVELWDRYKNRARLDYELEEDLDVLTEDELITEEDYLFPLDGGKPIRKVEPPPETVSAPPEPPIQPIPAREKAPAPAKKTARRRNFYDQNKEQAKEQLFADFDVDQEALARVAATRVANELDARQSQRADAARAAKPAPEKPAKKPVSTAKKSAASPTDAVPPMTVEEAADIAGVQIQSADMDEAAAVPAAPEKIKIDKDAEAAAVAQEIEAGEAEDKPEYIFPPVDLLNSSGDSTYEADGDLDETETQLENAVRSFGVGASVVGAVHGPTITRYELKLDQGVKLNKITNLAGDIALSLGVKSVRIAPVPDKISTVGVEVPNKNVRTVWLGDLVDSDEFKNSKYKLCVALGKDIGGNVIVSNLAKMPHLLIAGTTGSGKSVCVNSMILSLLYKSTPEEVRMIMIDPKMVEFVVYNGMPHLYVPVVTDAKKAAGALQWAVVEMLKRYRLFSETGVRELSAYNAIKKKEGEETLPQVVIFIDELADLMMVASKEVEESVCRVAQMGRAAGMHLVIATQSPRADVITGLMKANIPSRIALSVSGPLESRIILDQQGAEKLLGNGDMLYSPIGSKPVRLQGAFVTDEEREEIINFVKKEAEAEYSDEILAEIEKAAADKDAKNAPAEEETGPKSDYDELLPQAVEVIFETKQASVSMLQRRLKLGYSRAARLIDQLEEVGVVGPYEGSKPRQIVITKQQWQEMQYAHGTAPVDTIAHEFAQVAESDEFAPAAEETSPAEPEDAADEADVFEKDDGEDDLL